MKEDNLTKLILKTSNKLPFLENLNNYFDGIKTKYNKEYESLLKEKVDSEEQALQDLNKASEIAKGHISGLENYISQIKGEITKYSGRWYDESYKNKIENIYETISSIESEIKKSGDYLDDLFNNRISEINTIFLNSTYAFNAIDRIKDKWNKQHLYFRMFKWIAPIVGLLLTFYLTVIPLHFITGKSYSSFSAILGLLAGFFSYAYLKNLEEEAARKISRLNTIGNGPNILTSFDIDALKQISKDLELEINIEEKIEKNRIETLIQKAKDELEKRRSLKISELNLQLKQRELIKDDLLNKNETLKAQKIVELNSKLQEKKLLYSKSLNDNEKTQLQKLEEHYQKLKVAGEKFAKETSALRTKTSSEIETTKTELITLVNIFNQLPESFSPDINWNNENIFISKSTSSSIYRIGSEEITINLEGIQHKIDIPKYIPFVNETNIVFNCKNTTDTKSAVKISHNLVARALLAMLPGKAKFTFIDPLELGGNAAPFTPLLRDIHGGMVYTQASDIENQLSVLIRTIENVIQKYLQNKFVDIADYNKQNEQVPEPYRFLVVYNFPHGFNETTANKLLNIIKSGPKSGVHTILINDRNAKLPYGLEWSMFSEVNMHEVSLTHKPTFEFDKDLPFGEIVDYINKELPNVSSIKVPFTKYIPPQSEWWKDKAHKRYAVPIGSHALELQNLKFDNDDDNQALLIGKPGSGKSNLLHVIIANSLWKYSPDQLEIYLIDFKGGVEFSIYADKKIPHIRTIAIESEREFGLSVLDGVEKELLRRETEFSKVGVQNIEQYHENFPNERMPRVLLIVDEFQEFFAEDDSIKQAVDDKFDRIVRKGRAFGINSLFSSQTLSGNSIKKHTRDLIDIRIALMCSDTDTTQILDERNHAARDLTRPGEGIYNPENGKIEGNRRFQAFFMEKNDLNKTIESVVSYAEANKKGRNEFKQIIFRGSEKALIEKSSLAHYSHTSSSHPTTFHLWLGQPIAIDNDVRAVFKRQGGSNMLIVGNDEDIAVRIISSSITSLLKQPVHQDSTFYFFNFFDDDTTQFKNLKKLFEAVKTGFKVEFVEDINAKKTLDAITDELEQRQQNSTSNFSNIFIIAASIQRGRIFRKDGPNMTDEAKKLTGIIKNGTYKGIHSIIQIDSMDSFGTKIFEDRLLPDFSQRVATQMNDNNSRKLLGNDKATKLGNNRAYYFWDTENKLIKFKPYELPDMDFLK
jgi:DNA segregation ATPase FtsK/SpoIIIE-like protein